MKFVRIGLYIAFGIIALWLWNDWQQEFGTQKQAEIAEQIQEKTTAAETSLTDHSSINAVVQQTNAPQTQINNLITVTTNVLVLKINPLGGNIVTASLLKYPLDQAKPDVPMELLNTAPDTLYVTNGGLTNVPGLGNKAIPFIVKQTQYIVGTDQSSIKVLLNYSAQGLAITKIFTINANDYAIPITYQITNKTGKTWEGRYFMEIERHGMEDTSKDHLIGFHTFYGVAVSSSNNPYQKYRFKQLVEKPLNQYAEGGWLASIQHYFLSAWVPDPKQNFYYYSKALDNQQFIAGLMSPSITVNNGESAQLTSQLYIGPEIASLLNKLAPHLALTIDYGWLWIISEAIFWLLQHVYNIIGNWGWSIVIVTILIKLLFYKLSESSYKSMAKMRALQPKMEALKERFSGDRQQLSKATMELYRKEKVNPLGGCLPILVQIPVFIALYWVLVESVQLRQAPFMLWIHNLSAPDPYYVLPLIMGGTMFLQQRLSPAPPDPMQAKMMMFLPVVFTIMFLHFPSGLVLYWIVNNTVSILQQWYIMRRFNQGAYKKKSKKAVRKKSG